MEELTTGAEAAADDEEEEGGRVTIKYRTGRAQMVETWQGSGGQSGRSA